MRCLWGVSDLANEIRLRCLFTRTPKYCPDSLRICWRSTTIERGKEKVPSHDTMVQGFLGSDRALASVYRITRRPGSPNWWKTWDIGTEAPKMLTNFICK
jgi:hypothetical protein